MDEIDIHLLSSLARAMKDTLQCKGLVVLAYTEANVHPVVVCDNKEIPTLITTALGTLHLMAQATRGD